MWVRRPVGESGPVNRWDPRSLSARTYTLVGLLGVALSALLVVVGHVDPNSGLDPLTLTVSEIALSDRGGAVDVAMVTLALASLALLRGARLTGVPAALVGVWSAGLLVAAIVPTDPPGVALGTGGQVHRYASLIAFVCLPVAGFALARRARDRRVWVLSVASAACLLMMLGSATLAHRQLIGLAERMVIAVEVALLVMAVLTRGRAPGGALPAASRR